MRFFVITFVLFPLLVSANETCNLQFSTGQRVPVELAVSQAEQIKGLSSRNVTDNHSMLFVWPNAALRVFWMKDTNVDIEVGFFDADLQLFAIEPMQAGTLAYHYSPRAAKAALELPAGAWQRLGLRSGVRLILDACMPV